MTQDLINRYLEGNMHPADAFAEVRAELSKLKKVDDLLRQKMIDNPDLRQSETVEVDVEVKLLKRLDRAKVAQVVGSLNGLMTSYEVTYVKVKTPKAAQ
jgi:hypothetical protein